MSACGKCWSVHSLCRRRSCARVWRLVPLLDNFRADPATAIGAKCATIFALEDGRFLTELQRRGLLAGLEGEDGQGGLVGVAGLGVADLGLGLGQLRLAEFDDAAESELVAGLREIEREVGLVE